MAIEYLDTPASDPSASGGKFEYLDNAPAPTAEALPTTTSTGFPEPQVSDNPPAGAEKPFEQKLAENIETVGAGAALPSAIEGVAGLAKGAGKLLTRGAGKLAEVFPGTENLLPTIERTANNQMLKSTGASMGQIRQIGPEAARQAAQVGREAGLGDVLSSEIGREKSLANLDKTTGEAIGEFRKAAGPAGQDVLEKAIAAVSPKYASGVHSGEQGALEKAIETARQILGDNPTHADYSKAATALNEFATANKIYQPVTAATDLANAISRENNAQIAQSLGSEKALQYLKSLSDEQAYKTLEPFFERGELREMAGRGGVRGIVQQVIQSLANKGGYRLTAKFMNALHQAMGSPVDFGAIGKSAETSAKTAPLVMQRMADGGAVSSDDRDKELRRYLREEFSRTKEARR